MAQPCRPRSGDQWQNATMAGAKGMTTKGCRALVAGFDWSLRQRGIAAAVAGVQPAG
jgi:hypothetical protein